MLINQTNRKFYLWSHLRCCSMSPSFIWKVLRMLIYGQCTITSYYSVVLVIWLVTLSCSSSVLICQLSQLKTKTGCGTLRWHLVVKLSIRFTIKKWCWWRSLVKSLLHTRTSNNHGNWVSPMVISSSSLTGRPGCVSPQMMVPARNSSSRQLINGIVGIWLKKTVTTSGYRRRAVKTSWRWKH